MVYKSAGPSQKTSQYEVLDSKIHPLSLNLHTIFWVNDIDILFRESIGLLATVWWEINDLVIKFSRTKVYLQIVCIYKYSKYADFLGVSSYI